MNRSEQRAALMARIDTLERHAATLEEAFTDDDMKAEARALIDTLRQARESLNVNPFVVDVVEHAVDAASLLLASLGRAT
jgi:hypothetical protein